MRLHRAQTLIAWAILALGVAVTEVLAAPNKPSLPSKQQLLVKGATLPGFAKQVPGLTDSYAGLLPVSDAVATEKMFFWLWPPKKRTAQTDSHLTVWFGGGPGCSGLSAFFQQNGPISVPDNKENRTIIQPNKYSFTDFGWTMWLDHPVPTGLSQGELDHANEEDVAQQFLTFMKNLYSIFPELHSKKLWFAGESYAGQYIPHLSDHLHNQTDNLNLSGFMIADGRLSGYEWQKEIPVAEFAAARQTDLHLNKTDIALLQSMADRQGLSNFVAKNLHWPPKGKVYLPKQYKYDESLPIWKKFASLASQANECTNVYAIQPADSYCPPLYSPTHFPRTSTDDDFIGAELKKYLHADPEQTWKSCLRSTAVFGNGDASSYPMQTNLLARVISKSQRSILMHGQDDAWLLPSGTDLLLQNYTWGGKQGFTQQPSTPIKVNGASKGVFRNERGLLYAKVPSAGHEVGKYQPAFAYKMLQYMLGYIDEAGLSK